MKNVPIKRYDTNVEFCFQLITSCGNVTHSRLYRGCQAASTWYFYTVQCCENSLISFNVTVFVFLQCWNSTILWCAEAAIPRNIFVIVGNKDGCHSSYPSSVQHQYKITSN